MIKNLIDSFNLNNSKNQKMKIEFQITHKVQSK